MMCASYWRPAVIYALAGVEDDDEVVERRREGGTENRHAVADGRWVEPLVLQVRDPFTDVHGQDIDHSHAGEPGHDVAVDLVVVVLSRP